MHITCNKIGTQEACHVCEAYNELKKTTNSTKIEFSGEINKEFPRSNETLVIPDDKHLKSIFPYGILCKTENIIKK